MTVAKLVVRERYLLGNLHVIFQTVYQQAILAFALEIQTTVSSSRRSPLDRGMIHENRCLTKSEINEQVTDNMLCSIYKSTKKDNTYLYINNKDDFSPVPDALLKTFGTPQFVMVIKLDERHKLAQADIEKVKAELKGSGYYLQVPPPVPNLLEQYKADKAASSKG